MKESKAPFVSITTLIIMGFGIIFAFALCGVFLGGAVALIWVICTAVLFLCECLFGLMKKRFSKNVGALVAAALMGVGLITTLLDNDTGGSSLIDLSDAARAITLIMFLPPMIVSLGVNIGNIIYKVRIGKAGRPSDQQP